MLLIFLLFFFLFLFCFSIQNGLHATHIILKYEHNNKDVILDLQQNDNLIPLEHYLSYQHSNGDKAIKNFTKTEIDLCNYHVSIGCIINGILLVK